MNEMDKYKVEEEGQGELIERLREKVHNFLYSEESSLETSQNNISLPNIKPNSNNSQSKYIFKGGFNCFFNIFRTCGVGEKAYKKYWFAE